MGLGNLAIGEEEHEPEQKMQQMQEQQPTKENGMMTVCEALGLPPPSPLDQLISLEEMHAFVTKAAQTSTENVTEEEIAHYLREYLELCETRKRLFAATKEVSCRIHMCENVLRPHLFRYDGPLVLPDGKMTSRITNRKGKVTKIVTIKCLGEFFVKQFQMPAEDALDFAVHAANYLNNAVPRVEKLELIRSYYKPTKRKRIEVGEEEQKT